ncbi:hypothetical protein [Bradyrhizobium prioriisuperbiae]|uniref:hypothetical protein n=1 Tax=Bradyrhizobium prioriisuperbiae TaxID=2854389 RepID=UPI0028E49B98|nr:hypothetical protein [Bradyrhizobium prioritasuperba]
MIRPSLLLRRILIIDAVFSAVSALSLAGGASLLAPLLNLPEALLRESGLFLVVYAALVGWLGTRAALSAGAVWAVIAVNAVWVLASVALLFSPAVSPNWLGEGAIVLQAIAVGVIAELQYIGLRRSAAAIRA